ncbi:MAG: N-acetyltransferase family protein [Actinomycetota bacterium]|nr:N-acetyltransferase family protein [Actinomycetota bacterium]
MDIRLATVDDAEAIAAIYNLEVSESTVTLDLVPRSLAEQHEWLDSHGGVHPAIVAVDDGAVMGFGALSPYRSRPAYSTTVEDSVYVGRDRRGQGVGRALLDELIVLGTRHGFHTMIARAIAGHEASIGLHRACGFELVGVEREVGRKFGIWLDIVELQRML